MKLQLLTKMYNLLLQTDCAPEKGCQQNTHFQKKALLGVTGKYRLVSLISIPGKLIDSLIKNKISMDVYCMIQYGMLGKSEYDFCQEKSCL